MTAEPVESMNATLERLVRAISRVDSATIEACCSDEVALNVPGARDVDLTQQSRGNKAFATWTKNVHAHCGATSFALHRYFENGCEMMATGDIHIERLPRRFSSPCSIHVRFQSGRIVAFQLLVDTYALDKFRGEMD